MICTIFCPNEVRLQGKISVRLKREEKLNSLLMKMKEESEKAGLKFNIQETKMTASSPIPSWQIDGKKVKIETFYFLGLQNHFGW